MFPTSALRKFSTTMESPAVTLGPALTAGAAFLVTSAILFAPANEFDDLDCQSHCQRVCMNGICIDKSKNKDLSSISYPVGTMHMA